ncbi:MAG: polyketide cyclase / dehydrase and lipid transport [Kineosporiaceae bacterium]
MPDLDIVDDTFIVADPAEVAAVVAEPASWRRWWPDLEPVVTRDRGVKGVQWAVGGAAVGSMEIWLEPYGDGVILHYYLRADLVGPGRPGRERERRRVTWKRQVHALKDRLEAGREPGRPRAQPADAAADAPAADPHPSAGPGGGPVKDPGEPAESPPRE